MASLVVSDLLVAFFSMPFSVVILLDYRTMPTWPDVTFNKYLQVGARSVRHRPTLVIALTKIRGRYSLTGLM